MSALDALHWSMPARTAAMILLEAGLKSVVVLAVAGLVMACMKRRSAAARHLVCFLAAASLLALPVLSWALPGWRLLPRWMEIREENPAAVERQPETFSPPEASPEISPDTPRIDAAIPDPFEMPQASAIPIPLFQMPAASTPVPARASINGWRAGLLAWLAGAVIALAPAVLGVLSLLYLEFSSRRETGSDWLDLLGKLLTRLGIKRRVVLLRSAQRRMPMTWGVLRPKVLLPEESHEWQAERRRVVLLHELAHAQRFDYLTQLITRLVCALYWFNPLVWLASRRMVAEREHACDDVVLRHGAEPADYAEQVLEISAGLSTGWLAGFGGISMARTSNLETRLCAILDTGRRRNAPARAAVLLMVVATLLIVVPVAIMRAATNPVAPAQSARLESNILASPLTNVAKLPMESNMPALAANQTNSFGYVDISVSGSVVDADTHLPIPEFTVTPGWTLAAGDLLRWDINERQSEHNGHFVIGLYDDYAIKVEAPGYLPEMTVVNYRTNRFQTPEFELHKGEGFTGTVVGPDGGAVENAQVFYSLWWTGLRFEGPRVALPQEGLLQMQRTPVVTTDAHGRYSIPGRPGINSLIVLHSNGFAEIPRQILGETRVIHLQPWTNTALAGDEKGLKVHLKATQKVWPYGTIPRLTAEIRSDGGAKLMGSSVDPIWRLEVDAEWFGEPIWVESFPHLSEIKTGLTLTNIMVTSEVQMRRGSPFQGHVMYTGGAPAWEFGPSGQLSLLTGKHIIRLAVFAVEAGPETEGTIAALSDPVEIEMAAPPEPSDPTIAKEKRHYGPEDDGLRAALELDDNQEFTDGKSVDLRFHVRNTTNHEIQIFAVSPARTDQFTVADEKGHPLPVSIGEWHSISGPGARTVLHPGEEAVLFGPRLVFHFKPGEAPDFSGQVVSAELVKPGKYTVRFGLRFDNFGDGEPADWHGFLETGPVDVRVK